MVGTISGVVFSKRGEDYDIQLVRGADVSFGLVWGGSNNPIDVTGFDAACEARVNAADVSAAFEMSVTVGSTDGLITFSMTAAETAALTLGNYVYALEVIDDTSKHIAVMSGKLKVVPGVP